MKLHAFTPKQRKTLRQLAEYLVRDRQSNRTGPVSEWEEGFRAGLQTGRVSIIRHLACLFTIDNWRV